MHRRARSGLKRLNLLEIRATGSETAQPTASVVDDNPSPSTTAASMPSLNTTTLAVVISIIGASIILAIAVWKYRNYRRRKTGNVPSLAGKVIIEREYTAEKTHIDLSNISIYTEKPEKAAILPTSIDSEVGWVPQLRSYPLANGQTNSASPKSKTKPPKLPFSVNPSEPRSPPPSYSLENGKLSGGGQSISIPIPPTPAAGTNSPPPPTPPANRKTATSFRSLIEKSPIPSPAPRHESFAAATEDLNEVPGTGTKYGSDNKQLPRLMSVLTTFTPTLEDELSVKAGDIVRLVEEYLDGWCLCQRVGRIDAPKGAVPRFCLEERRSVVPILPTRQLSNGSSKYRQPSNHN